MTQQLLPDFRYRFQIMPLHADGQLGSGSGVFAGTPSYLSDAVATQESILRRFWKFRDLEGGRVDTLHREEMFYAKAVARLEKAIKNLDCRRTFFLSYDLAARHPQAHAVAFARFLGVAKVGFFRSGDNTTVDCAPYR